MVTNLDRYKNDLDALLATGERLHQAMQLECFQDQFLSGARKKYGEGAAALIKDLPSFADSYQPARKTLAEAV